jgi:large subunit ribosomal protein L13
MKTETNNIEHTIDAAGKKIGRVASVAAQALMGKKSASYVPHIDSKVAVKITNASKLHITEKKRVQKKYRHYSQYPGGLKEESLGALLKRRGHGHAAVLKKAIERMMPRNTLRIARMKRLTITD